MRQAADALIAQARSTNASFGALWACHQGLVVEHLENDIGLHGVENLQYHDLLLSQLYCDMLTVNYNQSLSCFSELLLVAGLVRGADKAGGHHAGGGRAPGRRGDVYESNAIRHQETSLIN